MIRALPLCVLLLAGCSGDLIYQTPGRHRVVIDEDVFFITVDSSTRANAKNYATGLNNQERLMINAQRAITSLTGCAVTQMRQQVGVNTYDAHLDCA